jgi:hypothetical protein
MSASRQGVYEVMCCEKDVSVPNNYELRGNDNHQLRRNCPFSSRSENSAA